MRDRILEIRDRWTLISNLEVEHDNLRAAMAWSLTDKQYQDPGAPHIEDAGLRLCGALAPFWRTRGHLSEGRDGAVFVFSERTRNQKPFLRARAKALTGAGTLANTAGRLFPPRVPIMTRALLYGGSLEITEVLQTH